jgi:hypothetical protein
VFRICQAETSCVRTLIHRPRERNVLHYTAGGRKTQSFAAAMLDQLGPSAAADSRSELRRPDLESALLLALKFRAGPENARRRGDKHGTGTPEHVNVSGTPLLKTGSRSISGDPRTTELFHVSR